MFFGELEEELNKISKTVTDVWILFCFVDQLLEILKGFVLIFEILRVFKRETNERWLYEGQLFVGLVLD